MHLRQRWLVDLQLLNRHQDAQQGHTVMGSLS
jgi:hypothetical protein